MNQQEFVTWWNDYAGRFPSTAIWVRNLGEEPAKSLLLTWAEVLADTPLRDALRVNRAMAKGELEPVGSYDSQREKTALCVRRAAARAIADRKHAEVAQARTSEPARPLPANRPNGLPSIAEALAQCQRLVKSGRTWREAVNEVIPVDEHEPPPPYERYKCPYCRDRGIVIVWHHESVRVWRHDPSLIRDKRGHRLTMAVPCSCEEGERHLWLSEDTPPPKNFGGWTTRDVCYTPDRYCAVKSTTDPEDVEKFCQWCEEHFRPHDTGMEHG